MKITIEVCQCDFCGIREITLPTCIVCGKHMCKKHQTKVDFGVFYERVRNEKVSSLYKETQFICPICQGDRKTTYLKLAEELIAKSEEVAIEEPPEEVSKL